MTVTWEQLHRALDRAPRRVPVPEGARRAAVAAILTPDCELLFMKRAEHPDDPWSGHLSFPGGRVEPGETVQAAAERETLEEVGIDLDRAVLLGELDEVATQGPLPRIVIRPYVWRLAAPPRVVLNEEAVSLHRLSLGRLLANDGRGSMHHPWRGRDLVLPRVDFDGVRLWGLTLLIVDDLLDRLDGRGRGLRRLDRPGQTPWDEPVSPGS
jgi:8-oxo-dGTP pyrophosphatase MutT (NUDIX family)